jgi:hypothetical protein
MYIFNLQLPHPIYSLTSVHKQSSTKVTKMLENEFFLKMWTQREADNYEIYEILVIWNFVL